MTSRDHEGAVRQYGRLSERQLGFLFKDAPFSRNTYVTDDERDGDTVAKAQPY